MDLTFLDRHRKKIDRLLKNVPDDPSGSLELRAHWAKYTCVVMYGYIESAVQELLRTYTDERCPNEVTAFVSAQLKYFNSATAENIGRLIAAFDKGWESSLSSFLDDERKAAINSVVGNRHRIAHGLDVSVTIHQLSNWYPKVNEVIDHITALCNK